MVRPKDTLHIYCAILCHLAPNTSYIKLLMPHATEVLAEEAAIRVKADEVRKKKEEIEMARGITLEDLTKGLLNYKFTGLSFVQGEKGALECVKFTVIAY